MFPLIIFITILTTLLLQCSVVVGEIFPKCCDSDSVFKKVDRKYTCSKDTDLRLQIITEDTDYINHGSDNDEDDAEGYCMETEDNKVYLFNVSKNETSFTRELHLEYFPKCCPKNYVYNTTNHGCVKWPNSTSDTFFDETLIKVGLPNCKIIVDLKFQSINNVKRVNRNLYLNSYGMKYGDGLYCLDKDYRNSLVIRVCERDYEICNTMKCIHKCCPDGQSFINGSKCFNTYTYGIDLTSLASQVENVDDIFAVAHGFRQPIYKASTPDGNLTENGVFKTMDLNRAIKRIVTNYYKPEEEAYCIEHVTKNQLNFYTFFRTFSKPLIISKFIYTRVAMAASSLFLIITLIYYCISDEKLTVFGKTLISYCFSHLVSFTLFTYLSFDIRPKNHICTVLAFVLFYCLLTSFAWLNIICVDIYWTFGSPKSFASLQHRSKELKRFMLYSLYGWGFPAVLTAIIVILYHIAVLPPSIAVLVDSTKCFIYKSKSLADQNMTFVVFAVLYMSLSELCNIVLFLKTVSYCLRVRREIRKMNDTHALKGEKKKKFDVFKDRFGLLIKLFVLMGATYLFEIVTMVFDFKRNSILAIIELVWDVIISSQGVFIFFIFVFKKRILLKLKKGLPSKFRKCSMVSSTTTQSTLLSPPQINNK